MKQRDEQNDPMRSTRITYALVLRTKLEDLPALKSALEPILELHRTTVIYQQTSVGYLRIVEESFSDHSHDEEERYP